MAKRPSEKMAEESREIRFRLHNAVAGNLSDEKVKDELRSLLPDDINRTHKLKRWKERGLWPIPADELAKHGAAYGILLPGSEEETQESREGESQSAPTSAAVIEPDQIDFDRIGLDDALTDDQISLSREQASLPADAVALLARFHEQGGLGELIEWWETTKAQQEGAHAVTSSDQGQITRHIFKGDRVSTGLLLNKAIKERAAKMAQMHGLSLSQLIEQLMWQFIGSPQEFLG